MNANIYLHPDTFIYNKVDTYDQISSKLGNLVNDFVKVITEHRDENSFKVPMSLMTVPVYKKETIIEIAESCLCNDSKGVFYTMLTDTSDKYDGISLEELRKKCIYCADEEEVNSILVFNVPAEDLPEEETIKDEDEAKRKHRSIINDYITFEKYEVVYNKQTWYHLRRQILGNHPETPSQFICECKKYFPNLCFHDNCVTSLVDEEYHYLETSPRKIIYYLSCLNDKFNEVYKRHLDKGCDANTILKDFSGIYGLDETGSLQQRPEKKPLLTFCFKNNDNSKCDVLCEPHLKISKEDSNCKVQPIDYRNFHPRIYFSFSNPEVERGRILVGSIGQHI